MQKKSQAAIENLMTYGWALLATLIAIGALWYFGILDFNSFLPERCTLEPPLSCDDFVIGNDGAVIVMTNAGGRDLNIGSISLESDTLSGECTGTVGKELEDSQQATFYISDPAACSFVETGKEKTKYKLVVTYSNLDSGLQHTMEGSMLAKYYPGVSIEDLSGDQAYNSPEMVGYWKFDDITNIGKDYSGKGNDGTFSGESFGDGAIIGATVISGKYGDSLFFDNSDYVDIPDYKPNSDSFTVTAWFRLNTAVSGSSDIFPIYGNNQNTPFLGYMPSDNNFWHLRQYSGDSQALSWTTTELVDSNWHYVALIVDQVSYTARLLVDGTDFGAQSIGSEGYTHNNGDLRKIGRDFATSWNGEIDEVRIYKKAISVPQVTEDMNSAYPIDKALASYSFENIDGNEVFDTHHIVKGKNKAAVSFDGNDDMVSLPPSVMAGVKDFTFALWAKLDSLGGAITDSGPTDNEENNFRVRIEGDGDLGIIINSGEYDSTAAFNAVTDNWHHIAISRSGSTLRAYKDGTKILSDVVTVNNIRDMSCFNLGRNVDICPNIYWGGSFNGIMDDIIIYTRALSDAEISSLAGS